jgi:hypothetical protein
MGNAFASIYPCDFKIVWYKYARRHRCQKVREHKELHDITSLVFLSGKCNNPSPILNWGTFCNVAADQYLKKKCSKSQKTKTDWKPVADWRKLRKHDSSVPRGSWIGWWNKKGPWWKDWENLNKLQGLVNIIVPMLIPGFDKGTVPWNCKY